MNLSNPNKPAEYWADLEHRVIEVARLQNENSFTTVDGVHKYLGSQVFYRHKDQTTMTSLSKAFDPLLNFEAWANGHFGPEFQTLIIPMGVYSPSVPDQELVACYVWKKGFLREVRPDRGRSLLVNIAQKAVALPLSWGMQIAYSLYRRRWVGIEELFVRMVHRVPAAPGSGIYEIIANCYGDKTAPGRPDFKWAPELFVTDYYFKTRKLDPSTIYFARAGEQWAIELCNLPTGVSSMGF